ncbi:hypothetical protein M3598_08110 [Cytobacillus oceanisediminis]|uniref:hypothetical protein n=1 Tax=Cytobacillus oceanisediminis TaxID=665099 RepID=UPI00203F878E|nr:hypothetical protein [Cytobacillus oceanisediminis]MCM3242707.1 hypothetical protein [Cytobacillus oceanisediminis]
MQVTVKAHFNKQTKDSKKELVQFYVKGDDEKKPELNQLTREVVELGIEGVEQKLTCEFKKSAKDSKKTVLEFIVKGDTSAEHSYNFYRKAGSDITLHIIESQMDIDDFREEQHEGVEYQVNQDGTASVSPDQLTLDDVTEEQEEPAAETEKEDRFGDKAQESDPFSDDDLLD